MPFYHVLSWSENTAGFGAILTEYIFRFILLLELPLVRFINLRKRDLEMVVTELWACGEDVPGLSCPLSGVPVEAGFPSPADDYVERALDLNELMVQHPEATFFVRVKGNSMMEADIHSGDILVVDRSRDAKDGCVVVAVLDGEFTVKQLRYRDEQVLLLPANRKYRPIVITPDRDFQVWGVVTYVIHAV